jgi:heme-degrading monooxygenase HmoA
MNGELLKSWAMPVLLASVVWVVGCTSQEESKPTEEEMTVSTVFLKHEVADYAAWRPVYDADEPRRNEAGLKEIGVYRDADDENMVLIVWETANTNAFKAMVESPDLAEKMKEAGVTSKPEVWIGKSLQGGMGTVFLRHKVADYVAWRPIYDADEPRRNEAGLKEIGVYRDADDENMILIVWETDDTNAFKAMVESPDLADKMKEAGVTSEPETWMGEAM